MQNTETKTYFEDLPLSDNILDALYDMRFEVCTPVQSRCIPVILNGRDTLGIAQTGTGKTAAYLLPVLSMIDEGQYAENSIKCIIMCPTRELVQQIDQAIQGFSYYIGNVHSIAVYGGNDGIRFEQERTALSSGADIIIATPGRLISHIQIGNIDLSSVAFFVLDEADRMLDMGFHEDILKIANNLPKDRQTIMFSATMPDNISLLARKLMNKPAEIRLQVSRPADKINQISYLCHENQKIGLLKYLFKKDHFQRTIIFACSKQKVKEIQQSMHGLSIKSGEMHSDLTQRQRDEVMFDFKRGAIDVLVATDIVSRGIDIDDIYAVINYDVPSDVEDYVHRIGRTARANKSGIAITLIRGNDVAKFMKIEKFLKKAIEKMPIPSHLGTAPEYIAIDKNKKHTAKKYHKKSKTNQSNHKSRVVQKKKNKNSFAK